jgi:hypothetical protein
MRELSNTLIPFLFQPKWIYDDSSPTQEHHQVDYPDWVAQATPCTLCHFWYWIYLCWAAIITNTGRQKNNKLLSSLFPIWNPSAAMLCWIGVERERGLVVRKHVRRVGTTDIVLVVNRHTEGVPGVIFCTQEDGNCTSFER